MGAFAGQRVLVTGGSSGLGAGLAEAFAREGATVAITARREAKLADVLARCRAHTPDSRMYVADLSRPEEVGALAAAATKDLGGVDVLVNNAGIPKRQAITKLDMETVEAVMAINYLSPIRLTLALLPDMLERGSGRIINVSSVAATLSSPGEAAYVASKAAVTGFSESMAIDLWNTGVTVTVIYPGLVDTELFSLPGNDPVTPGVEPISVDEFVTAAMAGIIAGDIEVYVPAFFKDIAVGKAGNTSGFISGAAEYLRSVRS